MSARLNHRMRKDIAKRLDAIAFTKRREADAKARAEMLMILYDDYHRKEKAAMAMLPKGFLPVRTSSMHVVVPKHENDIELPLPAGGLECADKFINHKDWKRRSSLASLLERHTKPVGEKLKKVIDQSVQLQRDVEKFKTDTEALLASVTTIKRLYEIWPELKEFPTAKIGEYAPVAKLPAPSTTALTEALRLGAKK